MANKVLLKKSSVAAKVPVAADLDYGEIALNYQDGKIYYKKADNSIDSFTSTTGSISGVSSVAGNTGAVTATQLLTAINTVDGSGSGLDADLLDGINGASLIRSDTADTFLNITSENGIESLKVGGYTTTAAIQASYSTSFAAQPMGSLIWHDLLAFTKNYTTTYETYNGTTWSAATLNKELFAQKENQSVLITNGTAITRARWTFTNVAYSSADWLVIGHTYNAPNPNKTILVESSVDGVTWFTKHTSTYDNHAVSMFHKLDPYYGDAYLRITITWNSGGDVRLSNIKLLTCRPGDQGRGVEDEFPYTADGNQNIITGGNLTIGAGKTLSSPTTIVSTLATGTAPFTVASTTLVTNLNADLLDGYNIGTSGSTIPLLNTANTWSATQTIPTLAGNTQITGGLTVSGSVASGAGDMGGYRGAGTNLVLKGDSVGRSGIFFESEKDGVAINHASDYGFIQFHPYGLDGSTGESNRLVIGVANDLDDFIVLQAPSPNGLKFSFLNTTSGSTMPLYTVWHAGNDGAGSGLDADLLDGLNSSVFLRNDTVGQEVQSYLTINSDTGFSVLEFEDASNVTRAHVYHATASNYLGIGVFDAAGANRKDLVLNQNGTITWNNNTVWHAGNDGTGSGLDADLLDGYNVGTSGGAIPLLNGANTWSGNQIFTFQSLTVSNAAPILRLDDSDNGANTRYWEIIANGNLRFRTVDDAGAQQSAWLTATRAANGTVGIDLTTTSLTSNTNTIWHAGNDGAASGLDADLLDGQQGSYYLDTSATAQTKAGDLTITGNLTVNGTTVTINSTTISVDDKNLELGSVASPTNTTADGGGITLKGTTDKTFNWVNATSAWTSSEDLNLLTGKQYEINGTVVLSATALGSGVTGSSLTSVGTIGTGVWQGTSISTTYTDAKVTAVAGNTGAITATQLLTAINTVDGTGSGLDADLLGGVASSSYVTLTGTQTLTNKTLTAPVISGVTSIGFATDASDSASISTTISGNGTYFDFNLTDDNNNDWWRWRFTPSGSTVYDAMTLTPSANGVANLVVAGTITGTRLISNVATGTAPLTVASTTLVTNLNADLLDGLNSATTNTASTIVARDGSGNFAANIINPTQILQGTNTFVRDYASGYSTTIAASTIYEIGRITFTGSSQNIAIVGEIRGGTGASVGVTRFILDLRSDTLPGKTFTLFEEEITNLGRLIRVKVYQDTTTGLVVIGYSANTSLQNIGWSLKVQERGNYNYLQQTTTLTTLVTTGLTEVGLTSTVRTISSNFETTGTATATILISNVATGTAPLTVASTTLVTNLNADLLGGTASSSYVTLTGTQTLTNKTLTAPVINGSVNFDNNTLFVDSVNDRIGINTGTPSTRLQVGVTVADDNSYTYDANSLYVVHQTATSTTVLNDPKEVLLLARKGTSGQAFGAAASFRLSRYENSGVNSRTRLDLVLAHDSFISASPTAVLSARSDGNVGIGTSTVISDILHVRKDNTGNMGIIVQNRSGSGTPEAGIKFLTGSIDLSDSRYSEIASAGGSSSDLSFRTAQGASPTTKMYISSGGNVGIGTTTPAYKLQVNGSFAATTKSFVIDHPTKPDMKLRYGSLEGPENGVYVRGRLKNNKIELPGYWTKLVDPESITVSLTPIGKHQDLYVKSIENNTITVANSNLLAKGIDCFYVVYGERCDVDKLQVEISN